MHDEQILFFMARHGEFEGNAHKIFRGQIDEPLDNHGWAEAQKLRTYFSFPKWRHCFCSSLIRSYQTAKLITEGRPECDQPVVLPNLKPCGIGIFTGKPKDKEHIAQMQKYVRNPNEVIPSGESLNEFRMGRIYPILIDAIELGLSQKLPCLIVGHSSTVYALGTMITGNPHACLIQPGGVLKCYLENGELKVRAIFKPLKKDDSSFAI